MRTIFSAVRSCNDDNSTSQLKCLQENTTNKLKVDSLIVPMILMLMRRCFIQSDYWRSWWRHYSPLLITPRFSQPKLSIKLLTSLKWSNLRCENHLLRINMIALRPINFCQLFSIFTQAPPFGVCSNNSKQTSICQIIFGVKWFVGRDWNILTSLVFCGH